MKAEIHPEYTETTVRCSCGNTFVTRSTVDGDLTHRADGGPQSCGKDVDAPECHCDPEQPAADRQQPIGVAQGGIDRRKPRGVGP